MPLLRGVTLRRLTDVASQNALHPGRVCHVTPAPPPSPISPSGPFGSATVRPDSRTPYTDATNCRRGKRKPGGSGSGGGVRRPMNAFMVWSQLERRQMSAVDPTLHNAEISRRLGASWRRLSVAERRPYMEEADRLRVLHAVEFPDYKYTPRKSRRVRMKSGRRTTAANRKSTVRAVSPALPTDAYDSEVSHYFANSGGNLTMTSSDPTSGARRSSSCRVAGRRRRRRSLPPTPDSGGQADCPQRFRAITAATTMTSSTTGSTIPCGRFEFPAVSSPSDVQLGDWQGGGEDSVSDELDTPISLEPDAGTSGCHQSLFSDVGPPALDDATSTSVAGDDYCTPEVEEIVRDDWLEETIHNEQLI